jgi:DNA mismatch repair protein MutL
VIEVRDLFANTPARLKFLKSEATENAAAAQVVRAYALLRPDVRFELAVDGRRVVATSGGGDRRAAVAAVLGGQVAEAMLALEAEGLAGMVSEPRLSRGTREATVLAVNARPVSSHRLQHALEQAYLGRLERGRYPIAVLDLAVAPEEVDVNVHPAKREVRFRDEGSLYGLVQRAVLAALGGARPYAITLSTVAAAAGAPVRQMTLHEPSAALAEDVPAARRRPASRCCCRRRSTSTPARPRPPPTTATGCGRSASRSRASARARSVCWQRRSRPRPSG